MRTRMNVLVPVFLCAWGVLPFMSPSVSFPQSQEDELHRLLAAKADRSSDPAMLVKMARLYLDLGDDVYVDVEKRRTAYEAGAQAAKRALELQDANAEAHFLYAANLGSAARLKGMVASAFTVRILKHHVARALEIQQDHAPSLHMMGMMLEELPWVLGGDSRAALGYLQRAVASDPSYVHARLDLAKAYLHRNDVAAARRELRLVLETASPAEATGRHVREARTLLSSLE